MTDTKKTLGLASLAAVTGLAFVTIFFLLAKPKDTSVAALPDRPPTFEELMVLAEKGQASDSLVESHFNAQNSDTSIRTVLKLAEQGNLTAVTMACGLLGSGIGGITDQDLSQSHCETAAAAGKTVAQANLIYRDFNTDPENMNWQETYDAFMGLMKTDPSRAHRGLQYLYRQDHPKASGELMRFHLKEAIKHGNTNAMLALAEFDFRGNRKYRDAPRGKRNLEKAYSLNDFDAGYILAIEYRSGRYFETDIEEYSKMIQRMAAFLHPASMGELAYMYTAGITDPPVLSALRHISAGFKSWRTLFPDWHGVVLGCHLGPASR